MKFQSIFCCVALVLMSDAFSQSSNAQNAGSCYGMINASFNAGLIQVADIPNQDMAIFKKYNPTFNRVAKQMDECTGKSSDVQVRKSCIQKLGNKSDIDFVTGFFGATGYILAGKAQGNKGAALEFVNMACHGVN